MKVLRGMKFDWIVGAAAVVVALSVQARETSEVPCEVSIWIQSDVFLRPCPTAGKVFTLAGQRRCWHLNRDRLAGISHRTISNPKTRGFLADDSDFRELISTCVFMFWGFLLPGYIATIHPSVADHEFKTWLSLSYAMATRVKPPIVCRPFLEFPSRQAENSGSFLSLVLYKDPWGGGRRPFWCQSSASHNAGWSRCVRSVDMFAA